VLVSASTWPDIQMSSDAAAPMPFSVIFMIRLLQSKLVGHR
jgi:hypothetical protein